MKKFLKLCLSIVCTFTLVFSTCLLSASAAMADIKISVSSTATPPVLDGKVTQEEYDGNAPIVLDNSRTYTEGTWGGTVWPDGEIIKYYFTWDADNLYVGITVEGDKTVSQAHAPKPGDNTCPFGRCDTVQIGFNPGGIIQGAHPLIFCIGMNADGQPIVHGDAFRSEEAGKQSADVSDQVKGYSKAYADDGLNYEVEVAIPWSLIFVKGVGREGDGAPLFDLSGEKAGDGYILPIWLVYNDNDEKSGANVYIRTDAVGEPWVAEKMGTPALALTTGEAADPIFPTEASTTTTQKAADNTAPTTDNTAPTAPSGTPDDTAKSNASQAFVAPLLVSAGILLIAAAICVWIAKKP